MEYVDRPTTPSSKTLAWWEHTFQVPALAIVRILQQGVMITELKSRSAPIVNAPLPSGYHYNGPTVTSATPCKCSTVYYSVISACASCQDGEFLTSVSFFRRDAILVD